MQHLVTDLLVTLAYGVVGVVLMAIGYVLVDVATPGKLHELIWVERNRNAALLLSSNLVGVGTIVVAAIVASDNDFRLGLIGAGAYGILGLVIMAVAFMLLDAATPGKLGELLVDPEPHPAVWVSATVHLATGAIIAAAII
ncbi:DUF350 domain-containing protein [Micromonospora chalcea]|uniref:Uncharacterized membrane protein YjfL (UPF0719 family) n=2 Tax=Micromonospora TaxID=1873 RepID=A0ABR6M685_MICEC|nr:MULTISPECIES: DUF350 domain-containing protein [Micromonospora]AXO32474.1 conserved integral membrane protein [Micromonospora sp. B006]EWM66657.1 integral membrane protein [Micromonospora sp. M42]MBB5110875.1 uncharacterized membrane protein YjfL (UPF0719 family) [Micromonospora echinospora]MBC8989965.1 DUF350 domain-containing protein [Micromonospora chalcea]MBP1780163.1 uncharacterized membrane protein YjfL (UPF0719 family) [Micromonospora sp. HB375]